MENKRTALKMDRLEIRLKRNDKELVSQAAEAKGVTVSSYALAVLRESALADLERAKQTQMSDRDRDLFLSLLDSPPPANAALRSAFARYHDLPHAVPNRTPVP